MRDFRQPTTSALESPETMESPTSGESMWGRLVLVGRPGKGDQRVVVKVYHTTLEHFAVIYPDKKVANAFGCLNLKHSRVEPLVNCEFSFRVIQQSCDANALEFRAESVEKRDVWLTALKLATNLAKSSSHLSLSLPVLEEDDEE